MVIADIAIRWCFRIGRVLIGQDTKFEMVGHSVQYAELLNLLLV
jgi:hypothetical protein